MNQHVIRMDRKKDVAIEKGAIRKKIISYTFIEVEILEDDFIIIQDQKKTIYNSELKYELNG